MVFIGFYSINCVPDVLLNKPKLFVLSFEMFVCGGIFLSSRYSVHSVYLVF